MSQLNPVMSGKRLKSDPNCRTHPSSRKSNGPRRGSTGAVGVVLSGGIDPLLKRGRGNRSRIFCKQPNQYRATMTMAATIIAAINESARSRAFERGFTGVASSGGMTRNLFNGALRVCSFRRRTSGRRFQFAGKPAAGARRHRITRYHHGFNATAFLALEGTVVETGRSGFQLRQQHAILLACRAARPFDRGNLRRRYWLIFGHGTACVG
jgi:hypothetical protein